MHFYIYLCELLRALFNLLATRTTNKSFSYGDINISISIIYWNVPAKKRLCLRTLTTLSLCPVRTCLRSSQLFWVQCMMESERSAREASVTVTADAIIIAAITSPFSRYCTVCTGLQDSTVTMILWRLQHTIYDNDYFNTLSNLAKLSFHNVENDHLPGHLYFELLRVESKKLHWLFKNNKETTELFF